ncbi:MAG: glutamate formimidoyltransferase [Saprospiraceae bacterium]|nr:glutamate formimidoyltransferase [Saprospiraceae bacterium]
MKPTAILECVPNFSEGRDPKIISAIENAIRLTNAKLLNTDPGKSTNRTVITFAGHPDDVIEAAFLAIQKASELIDMQHHKGEHPRMGATDVCPLIPIRDITIPEAIEYSKKLAERVGKELKIPVYLYEYSATDPSRKNLSDIRSGEYEGFLEKIKLPDWSPDYGPKELNLKSGATVIGVRDFLIAYNINLNTTSVGLANEIAFDIRENGRPKRDPETNKLIKDKQGDPIRIPGKCPAVKAIGWYIDEYQYAQVSMNLTNINVTPLHIAYEECRKSAEQRGLLVTGSELVGLVPKQAMIDAGLYYLKKQKRSCGIPESEIIHIAIQSLGLNANSKFIPSKRIIEDMLEEKINLLIKLSLQDFANATSADSPTPGGGSVSAYLATLGASLSTMVANLSIHKKGYEDKYEEFNRAAIEGNALSQELILLVDQDTQAFNEIITAFRLPKLTPEDKKKRKKAIKNATITAIEVPLKVAETAVKILPITQLMVEHGNPNSISDAGVGALCVEAAVKGAVLNVKINASTLEDEELKKVYFQKADLLTKQCSELSSIILAKVNDNIK